MHLPPFGIDSVEPFGQTRLHVDALHDTWHDGSSHLTSHVEPALHVADDDVPVSVIVQCELLVHVTLPELPTLAVQVEWSHVTLPLSPVVTKHVESVHVVLHDCVHVPPQLIPDVQSSEQLAPADEQFCVPNEQSGPGHRPVFGVDVHAANATISTARVME